MPKCIEYQTNCPLDAQSSLFSFVLQAGLSRELALIQGPPGTGKTYVGIQIVKALLANTRGHTNPATEEVITVLEDDPAQPGNTAYRALPCVGPVLIVCFTNHALDQFLEGLVAAGLTSLVRVGGRYTAHHGVHLPQHASSFSYYDVLQWGPSNHVGSCKRCPTLLIYLSEPLEAKPIPANSANLDWYMLWYALQCRM